MSLSLENVRFVGASDVAENELSLIPDTKSDDSIHSCLQPTDTKSLSGGSCSNWQWTGTPECPTEEDIKICESQVGVFLKVKPTQTEEDSSIQMKCLVNDNERSKWSSLEISRSGEPNSWNAYGHDIITEISTARGFIVLTTLIALGEIFIAFTTTHGGLFIQILNNCLCFKPITSDQPPTLIFYHVSQLW